MWLGVWLSLVLPLLAIIHLLLLRPLDASQQCLACSYQVLQFFRSSVCSSSLSMCIVRSGGFRLRVSPCRRFGVSCTTPTCNLTTTFTSLLSREWESGMKYASLFPPPRHYAPRALTVVCHCCSLGCSSSSFRCPCLDCRLNVVILVCAGACSCQHHLCRKRARSTYL